MLIRNLVAATGLLSASIATATTVDDLMNVTRTLRLVKDTFVGECSNNFGGNGSYSIFAQGNNPTAQINNSNYRFVTISDDGTYLTGSLREYPSTLQRTVNGISIRIVPSAAFALNTQNRPEFRGGYQWKLSYFLNDGTYLGDCNYSESFIGYLRNPPPRPKFNDPTLFQEVNGWAKDYSSEGSVNTSPFTLPVSCFICGIRG